jgi:hypothetical protein
MAPSSQKRRAKQTRLAFTPLPLSSPASKNVTKQHGKRSHATMTLAGGRKKTKTIEEEANEDEDNEGKLPRFLVQMLCSICHRLWLYLLSSSIYYQLAFPRQQHNSFSYLLLLTWSISPCAPNTKTFFLLSSSSSHRISYKVKRQARIPLRFFHGGGRGSTIGKAKADHAPTYT